MSIVQQDTHWESVCHASQTKNLVTWLIKVANHVVEGLGVSSGKECKGDVAIVMDRRHKNVGASM